MRLWMKFYDYCIHINKFRIKSYYLYSEEKYIIIGELYAI